MNLLLFVLRALCAQRIDGQRRGRSHRRRILRFHREPLAERRHRRRHDSLGEALVIHIGHVVGAEPAPSVRRVEILAAKLRVEHVAFVLDRSGQLAPARRMLLIIVRIRHTLQIAADDCFRFVVFRHGHSLEPFLSFGNVHVAPHEVQQVGAL